jgi:glucokinase
VALPGLIDSESGSVRAAANLGWHNVQLRALFEQRLQSPVRVEHLGRAKARAEATWGQGIGYRNFVCLEIGSGIGAGVMVDGQILRGADASAGEAGHTLFNPRGPRCACGLNGCWEVFCASPAIRRRLGERLALDGESGSALSPAATIRELGQAAEQGDPMALRVVAETAELLARGLGSVIRSFDPGLIILSGPVVRDCPSLVEATRSSLGALKAPRKFDMPLLAAAQEPNTGVIAASVVVLFRHVEELAMGDAAIFAVNPDGDTRDQSFGPVKMPAA